MAEESQVQNSSGGSSYKSRLYSMKSCSVMQLNQRASLRRKIDSMRMFIENSKDITLLINLRGQILEANAAARKAYGYTLEELNNMTVHDLRAEKTKDLADKQLLEAYREGITFETLHVRKNGEHFPVEVGSHRIVSKSKKLLLSIIRDITDRKQLEKEFVETAVIKTIGKLASSLAHEIRNSMTGVYGFLQLAASQKIDPIGFAHHCDLMLGELDHANFVISSLTLAANDKAMDLQLCNLNQILVSMLPSLQALAESQGKSVEICLEDTRDIYLDPGEIKILVTHLITNALESISFYGKVVIRTQTTCNALILSVVDNGCGIKPEIQDKLGTPFFTTKDAGTGLGLVICQRIAIRHNAVMMIESSEAGTTVKIIFYKNQDCACDHTNESFVKKVRD